MNRSYIDVEITFQPKTASGYPFVIKSAREGQAFGILPDLIADPTMQDFITRLSDFDTDEDMLIELGKLLFDSLFRDDKARDVLTRTQGSQKEGEGIRLKMSTFADEAVVAGLPWEFLYDSNKDNPFALLDMSIVRYPQASIKIPDLQAQLPLRVLLTGAQPKGMDAAFIDRELNAILASLDEQGLAAGDRIKIVEERRLTRSKFQRLLRQGFHVWHFAGHGGFSRDGKSGVVFFEDATGSKDAVSARDLAILTGTSGVRLVVLDACETAKLATTSFRSIAPALTNNGVPAVIAMQFTVPEESTTAFAGEFYNALASGLPVDACVTEGRKAVMGATGLRRADWGIPVVYTRAADGVLFDLPQSHVQVEQTGNTGINVNFSGSSFSNSPVTISEIGNIQKGNEASATAMPASDYQEELAALNDQKTAKKRRLYALELQRAKYGIGADPHIIIEIEDLEKELKQLEQRRQQLEAQLTRTLPPSSRPAGVESSGPVTPSNNVRDTPPAAAAQPRRIDVAVPTNVTVGETFDLLIQVRLPNAPLLGRDDWLTRRKPEAVDQMAAPLDLQFPTDPRTGKPGAAGLLMRVVAPDFKIESNGEKIVEVPPDRDSLRVAFVLTAQKPGTNRITLEVYNLDQRYLGTIPVETEVRKSSSTASATDNRELVQVVQILLDMMIGQTGQPSKSSFTIETKPKAPRTTLPDPYPLTIRFDVTGDTAELTWESEITGTRQSVMQLPYDAATLPLVIKALDAVQWPNHPLQGPKFDAVEQERLKELGYWSGARVSSDIHQRVGQSLYQALTKDVQGELALRPVRDFATNQGRPLAYILRFLPNATTLAALPWELLWDKTSSLLLGRGGLASVERYLELPQALPPVRAPGEMLRILAISPNAGIPQSVREAERAARTKAWAGLQSTGRVEMEELQPATRAGLVDRIQNGPPIDIIHFYGHGRYKDGQGGLLFDMPDGGGSWVGADRLAALLGNTRLIVLHACQSAMIGDQGLLTGVAPALCEAGVPMVVGMQLTIRVTAATRFAGIVYQNVAQGMSIQSAVSRARQALFVEEEDGASWYIPTLTIRTHEIAPLRLIEP